MNSLIEHRRQLFTFEETLLLGEALRRMDYARYEKIVIAAIIRDLNIPQRLIAEKWNYSSNRF